MDFDDVKKDLEYKSAADSQMDPYEYDDSDALEISMELGLGLEKRPSTKASGASRNKSFKRTNRILSILFPKDRAF